MAFPLLAVGLAKFAPKAAGVIGKIGQGIKNVRAAKQAARSQQQTFVGSGSSATPPLVPPVQGNRDQSIRVSTEMADVEIGWQLPVVLIGGAIILKVLKIF